MFEIAKSVRNLFQPQAEILLLTGCDGELRTEYEQLGVTVKVIPNLAVSSLDWKEFRRSFSNGFATAASFDPSIVYANCSDCFWGVQIADRLRIPSLWCVHESVPPEHWCADVDTRYRMAFLDSVSKVTRMLFVANSTKELYANAVSDSRAQTIPNGIDIDDFSKRRSQIDRLAIRSELGVAVDDKMVSIIGTTTKRKGQDVFLQEMAALKKLMPQTNFRFFVVGARRSDFLDKIRHMAEELGLADQVTFVDEQPDVARYFVASDVVTLCSTEESAPLVSLEAFAFGVPLVSTEVFGLSEQLVHEQNSLCFSASEEGGLARSVERLFKDEALSQNLVRGGYQSLESDFSLAECTKRHWQEICQVFARHRAMNS